MIIENQEQFINSLKREINQDDPLQVQKLLIDLHPADMAELLREFEPEEVRKLFTFLDPEEVAEILILCDEDIQHEYIDSAEPALVSDILEEMEPDDAADIIGEIEERDEKKADQLLQLMELPERREVKDLLQYDEDTAGGIMTSDFVALSKNLTTLEAIEQLKILQTQEPIEDLVYIQVTDENGKLFGRVTLQDLVFRKKEEKIGDLCDPEDLIYVPVDTDQEEVANMMSKYDLATIPVVDNEGKLVGRITYDDIYDVIEEETTEDIFRMAGTSEDVLLTKSPLNVAWKRTPWLITTLVGGLICSMILDSWDRLNELIALAFFVPIITGMGGNIGTQSSAIMIRGLATGQVKTDEFSKYIFHEIFVGMIMGCFFATLVGFAATFMEGVNIGLTVGISMAVAIVVATTVGTSMPLFLKKIGLDPAIAAGPFVTTSNDLTGIIIYYISANILLGYFIA